MGYIRAHSFEGRFGCWISTFCQLLLSLSEVQNLPAHKGLAPLIGLVTQFPQFIFGGHFGFSCPTPATPTQTHNQILEAPLLFSLFLTARFKAQRTQGLGSKERTVNLNTHDHQPAGLFSWLSFNSDITLFHNVAPTVANFYPSIIHVSFPVSKRIGSFTSIVNTPRQLRCLSRPWNS